MVRAAALGALRPVIAQFGLAGAALLVLGLGSATWVQAGAWRDSESLWSWAVEADPECAICLNTLALAFMTRSQAREAEGALRRSLALREHPMTRNNLGGVLQVQGRIDEAEREYQRAVRLNPGLGQALANLGELYARQGRYEDALPPLRRVHQIAPGTPRIRATLGESLRRRGDQLAAAGRGDEAHVLFVEARHLQP
jgi:Flp pilus assembly protein TadD